MKPPTSTFLTNRETLHLAFGLAVVHNSYAPEPPRERDFFIDNLLVRILFIIEMIWWTGLAPWDFEFGHNPYAPEPTKPPDLNPRQAREPRVRARCRTQLARPSPYPPRAMGVLTGLAP